MLDKPAPARIDQRLTLLLLILLIAVGLRLDRITQPILDWQTMRQGHTALIARHFVEQGMNPLRPDIGGEGSDPVLWYNEFSLFPYLVAMAYQITGESTTIARLVNVLFSLGCVVQIYRLASRWCGARAGLCAALCFAILPMAVYYGRTVQRQEMVLFLGITLLDAFDRWLAGGGRRHYWTAAIAGGLAVLSNPPIAHIGLPMLYLAWKQAGPGSSAMRNLLRAFRPAVVALAVLILMPTVMWYSFALKHDTSWSIQRDNAESFREFSNPAYYIEWLTPAFFKTVAVTFWNEVLTPPGAVFLLLALVFLWRSAPRILYVWLLAVFIYFCLDVYPIAIMLHSYYYLNAVPVLCLFAGLLAARLWDRAWPWMAVIDPLAMRAALVVLAVVVASLGWDFNNRHRYTFPWALEPIIPASQEVQAITPPDSLVLIDAFDPACLYLTHRKGWTVDPAYCTVNLLESVRSRGCTHLILLRQFEVEKNPGVAEYLAAHTEFLAIRERYRILRFLPGN